MRHEEIFDILSPSLLEEEKEEFKNIFLHSSSQPDYVSQSHFFCNLGFRLQKKEYYIIAIDHLQFCSSDNYHKWHLWGKALFGLFQLMDDVELLDACIEKFEKGALFPNALKDNFFLWDYGKAWSSLGKISGEVLDLRKGLYYLKAAKDYFLSGLSFIAFKLDYAEAIKQLTILNGDLDSALYSFQIYQEVIGGLSRLTTEEQILHFKKAWKEYAKAACHLFFITHTKVYLNQADRILQEAILNVPEEFDLWLNWGELFLEAGWVFRQFSFIEQGLEKLTASRVKECDPIKTSAFLSLGLVFLGKFQDNYKFIHQGRIRLEDVLKKDPQNIFLLYCAGITFLVEGTYLSDAFYFEKSKMSFEKAMACESLKARVLFGLNQLYLAWSEKTNEDERVQKSAEFIRRAREIYPYSSIYALNHGKTLFQLYNLDKLLPRNKLIDLLVEANDHYYRAALLEESASLFFEWGCVLDALGEISGEESYYEEAVNLFKKSLQLFPNSWETNHQHALSLVSLGELTKNEGYLLDALMIFSKLSQEDQENDALWNEIGYIKLLLSESVTYSLQKKQQMKCESEQAFICAVRLGNCEALYFLACLYSLSGYLEASLKYLRLSLARGTLPTSENLENDPWLIQVKNTEEFKLLNQLRAQITENRKCDGD